MAQLKKAQQTLGIAAAIATVLTLVLTAYTIFFPGQVNDVTSSFAGPVDRNPETGTVRAVYVASQVKAFLYASGLIVLLAGAGIGTAYHWSSAASAGSVAAGRGKMVWLKIVVLSFPVILVLLLGIYLPQAVFQPTNEEELGRQFFLGAWALRSLLGGLVLGITYLMIAGSAAFLGFLLFVRLRRSLRLARYQRQFET